MKTVQQQENVLRDIFHAYIMNTLPTAKCPRNAAVRDTLLNAVSDCHRLRVKTDPL